MHSQKKDVKSARLERKPWRTPTVILATTADNTAAKGSTATEGITTKNAS